MKDATTTRTALLDSAEELAQTRGLNAFSFHDLARRVGISKASVHHHFPTKADLARQLTVRYREQFAAELASINEGARSPRRKLQLFAGLFRRTLTDDDRLCLCGVLAAEYATLPKAVQCEVRLFFDEAEQWLKGVLEEGRKGGVFKLTQPSGAIAKTFLATLEGAMIVARTFDDERRLTQAAQWLLASVDSDRK